jgi:hypothetical protein
MVEGPPYTEKWRVTGPDDDEEDDALEEACGEADGPLLPLASVQAVIVIANAMSTTTPRAARRRAPAMKRRGGCTCTPYPEHTDNPRPCLGDLPAAPPLP